MTTLLRLCGTHAVRVLLASTLLCGLSGPDARGQAETRGVALLGTAGGGPAFVRGNDAILFNPANLVLSDRGARAVLTLGNTFAYSGGSLLQFNYYNDYLAAGRHLGEAEITRMLDGWFGAAEANELRRAGLYADVVPLAVTVRGGAWAFGLAVRARSHNSFGVNRGWLDLLLRGTGENRDLPLDATFHTLATTEVSLAFSRRFDRLLVGVAPKLVLGTSYVDGTYTATVSITDEALIQTFDYTIRAAGSFSRDFLDAVDLFKASPFEEASFSGPFGPVAGKGLGLDLGLTYVAAPGVLVAASVTDLGSVAWDGDAQTLSPVNHTFRFEGLELNQSRINDEFDGSLGRYARSVLDSLARDAYDEVHRVHGGFSTALPAAFHFGSAWYKGRTTLNMGLSMALNDAPGNPTRKPSFHAGIEHRLGPVPLRTGVRYGGDGALTIGAGLGLRTRAYEFGLSVAATPKTDMMGHGGRYTLALSLVNIHI
ncbi:hypothetical protein GQ464_016750 [Rhodocaloribacter litoris]|uniref:DUF5723 family protein n=1 Tax=Rhodocaloribacter litoris TaxID=2558931 RepID=UPI001421730E|nr:DUF5723 family protein [Rhodocaloribacter litoris]QXD15034.1 hypothetical protein GQ464_016750 [Rhodocaloribacter litoris]